MRNLSCQLSNWGDCLVIVPSESGDLRIFVASGILGIMHWKVTCQVQRKYVTTVTSDPTGRNFSLQNVIDGASSNIRLDDYAMYRDTHPGLPHTRICDIKAPWLPQLTMWKLHGNRDSASVSLKSQAAIFCVRTHLILRCSLSRSSNRCDVSFYPPSVIPKSEVQLAKDVRCFLRPITLLSVLLS